jgi:hypothetical protein
MIIIKGLNFAAYKGFISELNKIGIYNITQINQSNQEFRMVKAECSSLEIKEQLIKSGLKLD